MSGWHGTLRHTVQHLLVCAIIRTRKNTAVGKCGVLSYREPGWRDEFYVRYVYCEINAKVEYCMSWFWCFCELEKKNFTLFPGQNTSFWLAEVHFPGERVLETTGLNNCLDQRFTVEPNVRLLLTVVVPPRCGGACVCMCVCMCVCVYLRTYVCMYVCMYVFRYICMYICMYYVCMSYVCIMDLGFCKTWHLVTT